MKNNISENILARLAFLRRKAESFHSIAVHPYTLRVEARVEFSLSDEEMRIPGLAEAVKAEEQTFLDYLDAIAFRIPHHYYVVRTDRVIQYTLDRERSIRSRMDA